MHLILAFSAFQKQGMFEKFQTQVNHLCAEKHDHQNSFIIVLACTVWSAKLDFPELGTY